METILGKLGLIIKGGTHDLLDRVIDVNSISALKQYARELEQAIEGIGNEVDIAEGSMQTAKDQQVALTAALNECKTNIDFILGDGDDSNDHLATPLMTRQIALEGQVSTAQKEVDEYGSTMRQVGEVESQLRAKLESTLADINRLNSLAQSTEAKDRASKALALAERMSGDIVSVDNIASRLEKKSNIADAKLRRAMGNIQTGLGQDAILQEAQARLAARKAQLTQQAENKA